MKYHVKKKELGKNLKLYIWILSIFSFFAPMSSNAALIDAPLPTNTYITLNGFDWAWGASCITKGASDCDTPSFGFQQALGWDIAQSTDMALAPTALDFLFPGANVPFNGVDPVSGASFAYLNDAYTDAQSAGACATAYFTLGDGVGVAQGNSCDWYNGGDQNVNTLGWFNQNGESNFYADVLFVRQVSVIPVPAAVWLFGTALIGLFGFSKRRKAA
jgi:hypothetical protein